jgi:hypothetical protein
MYQKKTKPSYILETEGVDHYTYRFHCSRYQAVHGAMKKGGLAVLVLTSCQNNAFNSLYFTSPPVHAYNSTCTKEVLGKISQGLHQKNANADARRSLCSAA